LYLSIDPNLLYREDAEVWDIKGEKLDEFKVFEGEIEVLDDVTEDDRKKVKSIIKRSMDKIVDSGHYIIRSTSLSGGGYVASGYYTQEEMESMIFEMIENNDYCKKNLRGYKQTAREMITKGMKSPLYLKD
jgi:ferritin-like metal-binding protein YciE